ncbi:MAG: MopE-related protein, partial [Myxococcota bacterium]|nr:MopE-related protein [Myxococcota bacterium]
MIRIVRTAWLLPVLTICACAGSGEELIGDSDTDAIDDDAGSEVEFGAEDGEIDETVGEDGTDACIPADEICDGLDNDCDTSTDEEFDLQTDVENCGACGMSCELPNADAICVSSACVVGACHIGFVDADGAPWNGCEYACTSTGSAESRADGTCDDGLDNDCDTRTDRTDPDCEPCVPELCDGLDNDCDGLVDEDFDLDFDPLHCGRCRYACPGRPNAVPICVLGECDIACVAGWEDRDGLVANGCETVCAPGADPSAETTCDGVDNDCDGLTDEGYVPYECGFGPCVRRSVCRRGR